MTRIACMSCIQYLALGQEGFSDDGMEGIIDLRSLAGGGHMTLGRRPDAFLNLTHSKADSKRDLEQSNERFLRCDDTFHLFPSEDLKRRMTKLPRRLPDTRRSMIRRCVANSCVSRDEGFQHG